MKNGTDSPMRHREGFAKLVVPSIYSVHGNNAGGARRIAGLCGGLLPWYDVEIVSLGDPIESSRQIILAPGFSESVVARSEHSPAFANTLERALENANGVLGQPFLLPLTRRIRPDLPFVYNAHNPEFALKGEPRNAAPDGEPPLDNVRPLEEEAVRDAQLIATCSNEDGLLLQREYGVRADRFVTVPNGVDTSRTTFVSGAARTRMRLAWLDRFQPIQPDLHLRELAIFIGSEHAANVQAALRIVDVAPRLPHVLFLMVGSHSDALRMMTVPRNVVCMGAVPEGAKASVMAAASVGLNPLEAGSGTNLRVTEYAAHGVPVVSTVLGTAGLRVADRVHLLVAPVAGLVQAIQDVLANPLRADERARAARLLMESEYDWSVLGSQLAQAIQNALARTSGGQVTAAAATL
jgi:glycosyltransferase involved in cell wall biosynthesis